MEQTMTENRQPIGRDLTDTLLVAAAGRLSHDAMVTMPIHAPPGATSGAERVQTDSKGVP